MGSTGLPSASLSSRDSNTVSCYINVCSQLQWCVLLNPVHPFLQGYFWHILVFGSWSLHECLHKHFRSYEPTKKIDKQIRVNKIENLLTNWYILKHFAFAFFTIRSLCSTIDLPGLDIVSKVLFKSMSTEALTGRSNGFTVLTIHITPMHIQSILSFFSYLLLILFKFLFTHHFTVICISNDVVVFNVSVNVPLGTFVHNNPFHILIWNYLFWNFINDFIENLCKN